jgi:signal transduction histidine kinase
VAVAIETARLYQDALSRNRALTEAQQGLKDALGELDVLFGIEKMLSERESLDGIIDGMVSQAMALCGAAAGSVLLLEQSTGQLYFKSALGAKGEEVKKFRLGLGQGIAGHVAEEGRPVIANEVAREAAWDPAIARRIGYPTRSALCVPIRTEDGVIGALELLNKPGGFDAADLRRLTLVAGQAARAVQVGRGRDERDRSARLASIGQMLSGVLHDLKTPMTVISGYAELMAEEPQADKRKRYGSLVTRQFEHVSAMTREILQFARGERELLVRNVYLNIFLPEMQEYLEREFAGRGIKLKLAAAYQGLARFDENKIARVIHNLARNAAQAMPDGGRFTIATRQVDGSLELSFADTGSGIPPEIAPHLFEAFVTRGKPDGTGLGLAIVKKAVEDHGGSVSFSSRPGRGTTFVIRLPL